MLRRALRPRVLFCSVILLAVAGAFVASLLLRTGFSVDAIKDRGTLARIDEDGVVDNRYRLQIADGAEQTRRHHVGVDLPGLRIVTSAEVVVEGTRIQSLPLTVALAPEAAEAYRGRANAIVFDITTLQDGQASTRREESAYLVPR